MTTVSEELLKKIARNTEAKESFQIVLSGNSSNFTTRFTPPLKLDMHKTYKIALVNLETYYSFPNIDDSNNIFIYSFDRGTTWIKFKIPMGSYDLVDINAFIQQELRKNGHYDAVNGEDFINISANTNTLKSILNIDSPNFIVDFTPRRSIGRVLGFSKSKYEEGFHESEKVVNILSVNTIFVNIDIIAGSYLNGTQKNAIYSFFPNVAPGYKIIESPHNLIHLPLSTDEIHELNLNLTDQDDNQLNLRGETLTVRFHIKEI